MKILSGLEYILRKAQVIMLLQLRVYTLIWKALCIQDWEAYAASHVSLCTQLEALTQLILDWRRMELKYVLCVILAHTHKGRGIMNLYIVSAHGRDCWLYGLLRCNSRARSGGFICTLSAKSPLEQIMVRGPSLCS